MDATSGNAAPSPPAERRPAVLGLILVIVVAICVAVWLAPMIPPPGGQIIRVIAWIGVAACVVYLLFGLLSGTGVPAFDD